MTTTYNAQRQRGRGALAACKALCSVQPAEGARAYGSR